MTTPGARYPLLVFLVLALPATTSAAFHMEFDAVLPGPHGIGSPDRPSSVTVDPLSEEVCVTDAGRVRMSVYTSTGVHTFDTGEIAGLVSPSDGTIEASGGFAFTDYGKDGRRTIKRLNFLGEPAAYEPERPSPDWAPDRLLVTRDGQYVTVDNRSGLLAKHDSNTGALLWARSLMGETEGEEPFFGRPAEAGDGRIYVPGGELHSILVFSPSGEPLTSFGRAGTARGELASPAGIAFGTLDRILVLDRMRHTVLLYGSDHRFLGEFGTLGSKPGGFYHPLAIAALPDGRLWVAQGFQGRVQAFHLTEEEEASPAESRVSS
jgi:DNA-binding beta-propeller fold protein YncE